MYAGFLRDGGTYDERAALVLLGGRQLIDGIEDLDARVAVDVQTVVVRTAVGGNDVSAVLSKYFRQQQANATGSKTVQVKLYR